MVASAGILAGCLSSPAGPEDAQPKLPALSVPEAYFMLTAGDVRSTDWPESWSSFDVFVCTPSMDPDRVAQARADRPDAIFLAYTSVADIHLGMYSNDPYWASLEAVFDSTLCVRDMWHDRVVRMTGQENGDPTTGIPYYVMQKESADILVQFHRDVTMTRGFQGLYLDNCTAVVPPYRLQQLFAMAPRVDIDNDGQPDDQGEILSTYATWRPYYTEQLRAALGDDVLLVANAGGALGDPVLNGITLEGVGDRFPVETAREYLDGQRQVGRLPFLAVGWVTTPQSDEPTRDLVPQMAGLHYGYVVP
jgi:hypothetical protein